MSSLNAALGTENILLISSDMATRIMIRNALFQRGYFVLVAFNEEDAAHICHLMRGKIDLIVADGVAPRVEVWADLGQLFPPILVLVDSVAASGDTREMANRVKKLVAPLTDSGIAFEVRAMLDSPNGTA
jgi:DNA-binding response OmpR family regulator